MVMLVVLVILKLLEILGSVITRVYCNSSCVGFNSKVWVLALVIGNNDPSPATSYQVYFNPLKYLLASLLAQKLKLELVEGVGVK